MGENAFLTALGVIALLPVMLYGLQLAQRYGWLEDPETADTSDWPM